MERRRCLSWVGAVPAVALAGCLQDGFGGDNGEDEDEDQYRSGMFFTLVTGYEDEGGYVYEADEEIPLIDDDNQRVDRGMRFTADNLEGSYAWRSESGFDGVEPATIDLVLANEADHARTLTFDGYVPMIDTHSTRRDCRNMNGELLVLPDYEPGSHALDVVEAAPGYVRSDDYWVVEGSADPPETPTTVTLEPGEAVGGRHVLLAPRDGPTNRRGAPLPCLYVFESEVRVQPDGEDDEFEFRYGFPVGVDYDEN